MLVGVHLASRESLGLTSLGKRRKRMSKPNGYLCTLTIQAFVLAASNPLIGVKMKKLNSLLHKIGIACAYVISILMMGIIFLILCVGWLLEKFNKKEPYIGF